MRRLRALFALVAALVVWPSVPTSALQQQELPPIVGRWDLTVTSDQGSFPSWFEVAPSGVRALVGRFVGRFGSSRPIGDVHFENGKFSFAVPPQWEQGTNDLTVEGTISGQTLSGTMTDPSGAKYSFTAVRAPEMPAPAAPKWDKPIAIFNGKDLDGWVGRDSRKNQWMVKDKVLVNSAAGTDLQTTAKYRDFKLHVEFRYPANGNAGVYLRGRHEVQISDNDYRGVMTNSLGGVYGFLEPSFKPDTKPGEWQTFDITLLGRVVTIVVNGKTIISERPIPGITGGAIDSDEGAPGPILLQGDHGPVEFRSIVLTPAK